MTVETRWLLKTTQTINGLLAKKLMTSGWTLYESIGSTKGSSATTVYMGIRVWKRASDGTETEITSGTPVAQVSATANRAPSPPKTATWACPLTTLVLTDSIVVRWYTQFDAAGWVLLQTCTTEQLGAQSLDSATWTVIYYWGIINITLNATSNLCYDGDIETEDYYDTSIINFTWTPTAAVAVKRRLLVGVGI